MVTVRPGDCLWTIAVAHHVTLGALYRANRPVVGANPALIYAGHAAAHPGQLRTEEHDTVTRPPVAQLIWEQRTRLGLSIRQAAARAGISEGSWRRTESNRELTRTPQTIARMAGAVGITGDQLAGLGWPAAAGILAGPEPRPAAAIAPLSVPLTLPQLPMQCPSCGVKGIAQWPLGVFGGRLNLTCPACHCIAAELVAVQDNHEHYPEPDGTICRDRYGLLGLCASCGALSGDIHLERCALR